MTIAENLLAEFNAVMDDCLFIHDKKFSKIQKQNKKPKKDPRSIRGHAERVKVMEIYAKMAEMEIPLDYVANDDKQYVAELRFAALMIEMNVFQADDFCDE